MIRSSDMNRLLTIKTLTLLSMTLVSAFRLAFPRKLRRQNSKLSLGTTRDCCPALGEDTFSSLSLLRSLLDFVREECCLSFSKLPLRFEIARCTSRVLFDSQHHYIQCIIMRIPKCRIQPRGGLYVRAVRNAHGGIEMRARHRDFLCK